MSLGSLSKDLAVLGFTRGGGGETALATVRTALPENGTYTSPDNTEHVINTAGQVYGTTFKFPLTPVAGQEMRLSTTNAVQKITLNGNGKTVVGDAVIALAPGAAVVWRYNVDSGWVPVVYNRDTHFSASTKTVAYAYDLGGWGWKNPAASFDWYVVPGKAWLQQTASGLSTSGYTPYLEFYAENTIDPSNGATANGQDSYSGQHGKIYDSTVPFGAGATADAKVEFYTAVTCRNQTNANCKWPGGPNGSAAWLTWGTSHATQRVPMYIGDLKGGLRAQFDVSGNFRTTNMSVDESVQRTTGTTDFTISDNVSTCVLAGSGTVVVIFPAIPVNGQTLTLAIETAYTSITLNGNGKTLIAGAAVGTIAGSYAEWRYYGPTTTWHRVG